MRIRGHGSNEQSLLTVTTEVQVRFNEADPLGIVWHGHYIRYFEDGREAFGQKYGLGYLDVYKHGYVIPIVSVECDFKKSLRYGENVVIETTYHPCDSAKIKFSYTLYDSVNRSLVAEGSSVQVFLKRETSALQLINPDFFNEWKLKNNISRQ